jgi:hypothetical protein
MHPVDITDVLSQCRSRPVEEVQFGPDAGLSDQSQKQERHQIPTPGDVLARIACVIAICLGLALVAQLLIAPPPGM